MATRVSGTPGARISVAFSAKPKNSTVIVMGDGPGAKLFDKGSTPAVIGTVPEEGTTTVDFHLNFFRRPWEYVLDVSGGDSPITEPDSSTDRGLPPGVLFQPDVVTITLVIGAGQ